MRLVPAMVADAGGSSTLMMETILRAGVLEAAIPVNGSQPAASIHLLR